MTPDLAIVASSIAVALCLSGAAADGAERQQPFFSIRRLMVCPTGRIAQGNEWCKRMGMPEWTTKWSDTLWENWSDERIRKYARQIGEYGFNSVELCEIRGYRGIWTDDDLKSKITPKLRTFMKAARDNGLQVSQFIWGQSLFEEGRNFCWNSPDERLKMEAEYRRLARTYGDLVDHIVIHVGDPGGCDRNGCDAYKTTQEIAAFLLNEYRKMNPKITCTLSTWANFGFWNGREGVEFLDESYCPKEIGIALHRWYDADKAKLVRAAGRECDIWGWYLSDFEMELDSALLMRRLDAYFTSLPAQASKEIRAISTEICFHGWPHIINAYVSAQKMIDPKRPLQEIEREFCAGTFGEANAEAMLKVYQAAEEYVHPERYYGFIPASDCLPVVFGTPDYNKRLRDALAAGHTVKFDPKRPPRFTASTDPADLHRFLMDNLRLISIFSEAQERIGTGKANGATTEELAAIISRAEAEAAPLAHYPDFGPLVNQVRKSAKAK